MLMMKVNIIIKHSKKCVQNAVKLNKLRRWSQSHYHFKSKTQYELMIYTRS